MLDHRGHHGGKGERRGERDAKRGARGEGRVASMSYSTSFLIDDKACVERVRENTCKEKSTMGTYMFSLGKIL